MCIVGVRIIYAHGLRRTQPPHTQGDLSKVFQEKFGMFNFQKRTGLSFWESLSHINFYYIMLFLFISECSDNPDLYRGMPAWMNPEIRSLRRKPHEDTAWATNRRRSPPHLDLSAVSPPPSLEKLIIWSTWPTVCVGKMRVMNPNSESYVLIPTMRAMYET